MGSPAMAPLSWTLLLLAACAAAPVIGYRIDAMVLEIDNAIADTSDLAASTLAVIADINKKNEVDPDVGKKTPEFIASRGFIPETHYIQTQDHYVLGVHRIVNPLLKRTKGRPVILHHGLLASSVDFVENSPGGCVNEPIDTGKVGNNLGFELAKRGYDVWLANSRGNLYSRNHTILSPKDSKFWDYTFDDMIAYDAPAVIEYVRRETNSSKVAWIGHSQGTTIMLGLLSSQPHYSRIVEPFIAFAPVATAAFISSPAQVLAHQDWLLDLLARKGGEFLPDELLRWIARRICVLRHANPLCREVIFFLGGGYDSSQLNQTRVPVYSTVESISTSVKNMIHWAQAVRSGRFQKFDYGKEGNMKQYGTPAPPEYPIEDIDSQHIALFSSVSDELATPRDLDALRRRLKVKLLDDYVVPYAGWSHIDFIWALEAGTYINARAIQLLDKYTDE